MNAVKHPAFAIGGVMLVLSLLAEPAGIPIGRITQIAIYTLYAMGVAVLVSYAGLVPFGACVFFGVAAYAAALSSIHLSSNEIVSLLCSTLATVALAAVLGIVILRRRGLYFSLLTLACSQIAFEVALRWSSVTGGDNGIQNVPLRFVQGPWAVHFAAVAIVLAVATLVWRMAHSPFGRTLQGIRDNEQRAASIGYHAFSFKYGAFIISGAIIGLAGALHTFSIRGAYANYLSWEHAGDALLMLLIGGAHHFFGSLWGAISFILLRDNLSASFEHWWLLFAPILIAFTLFAPGGINGLLFRKAPGTWTLVSDAIPQKPAAIEPLDFETDQGASTEIVLAVRGLAKRFGSVETARGLNLDIARGRLHSLIGPNGAGKTTFFNMLSGEIRPDAGQIIWCGEDVTKRPPYQRARLGLGRSFQIVNAFRNLTAFENVRLAVQAASGRGEAFAFWRSAYGDAAINARTWSTLELVGLSEVASSRCDKLAHGERRLLEIAITIATQPKLLLLDEPLAGLTERDRERVSELIRRLADTYGVLLVEHDVDRVLAMSDRISVLNNGEIIADGKPEEVANRAEVIAAYLGREKTNISGEVTEVSGLLEKSASRTPILEMTAVSAGYEGSRILNGIDFVVGENETVGILGRNGVGKTTLLNTIMGVVPLLDGDIAFHGQSLAARRPFVINQRGISIVPEGRRLFGNLSVADNLRLAARPGGMPLQDIFELFPKLRVIYRRRAEHLSGGERQMVAIARALVAPADLLLLDEPFEGLAPSVVQDVRAALRRLKGTRAMVLVEHDAEKIMSIADRIYVVVNGRVAFSGTASEFARNPDLEASLLGLVHVNASVSKRCSAL
jgi:ABC-type branched-subunit amino acid transport system ATPase component/ABC-type branched-subunit amino acid transport system permease subunit